jgi:hypothetical protein
MSNLNIATGTSEQAADWVAGATSVANYLSETDSGSVADHIEVPSDAEFYLKVMDALGCVPQGHVIAPRFVPKVFRLEEVTNVIAQAIQKGDLGEKYARAVRMMVLAELNWPWTQAVGQISTRIKVAVSQKRPEEADACVSILLDIAKRGRAFAKQASSNLKILIGEGYVEGCLVTTMDGNRKEGAARCAYVIFEYQPDGTVTTSTNAAAGSRTVYETLCTAPDELRDVASHFAFLVKSYMKLPIFAEHADKAKALPLAKFVLDRIVTEEEAVSYFNKDDVLASLSFIQNVFGTGAGEFLGRVPTMDTIVVDAIAHEFVTSNSSQYVLYLLASTSKPHEKGLLAFLQRGIESCDRNAWLGELRSPSDLSRLVALLAERGVHLKDEGPLSHALRQHAADAARGAATLLPSWTDLLSVLSGPEADVVARSAWQNTLEPKSPPTGRVNVLKALEPHMRNDPEISALADEVVEYYAESIEAAEGRQLAWLTGAFQRGFSPSPGSAASLDARAKDRLADRRFVDYHDRQSLQALRKAIAEWLMKHPPTGQ